MKTLTKIILLAACTLLAIGGVMIYAKTRVEPPIAIKQCNQYATDLQESRKKLLTAGTIIQKDSVLEVTLDRLMTFYNEERINSDEADDETDELLSGYIPFFMEDAYKKFSNNVWYEVDHTRMLETIDGLKEVKYSDKTTALSMDQKDSLSQIQDIILKYRKAKAVSRHTTFNGIQNAENSINDARYYLNDRWLSNCTSLANALRNVKSSIAASHYRYVLAKIEDLSQYRYYSKDFYFNTLLPNVQGTINEYDDKADKLYGAKQNVSVLRTTMYNYKTSAENYYRNYD